MTYVCSVVHRKFQETGAAGGQCPDFITFQTPLQLAYLSQTAGQTVAKRQHSANLLRDSRQRARFNWGPFFREISAWRLCRTVRQQTSPGAERNNNGTLRHPWHGGHRRQFRSHDGIIVCEAPGLNRDFFEYVDRVRPTEQGPTEAGLN